MFTVDNEKFSFDDNPYMYAVAVTYMKDDIREYLHGVLAPCTRDEFILEYIKMDPGLAALLSVEFGIETEV